MLTVLLTCMALIGITALIHYELLGLLNIKLPPLKIPAHPKLLVVIFTTMLAHLIEITLYGVSIFLLIKYPEVGRLNSTIPLSLTHCLYFSAETFTSLGFGDLTPNGPLRLIAGVEALNGLLLIGWSTSYTYLAMERFWTSNLLHLKPSADESELR